MNTTAMTSSGQMSPTSDVTGVPSMSPRRTPSRM
jgi:hypothetical protein